MSSKWNSNWKFQRRAVSLSQPACGMLSAAGGQRMGYCSCLFQKDLNGTDTLLCLAQIFFLRWVYKTCLCAEECYSWHAAAADIFLLPAAFLWSKIGAGSCSSASEHSWFLHAGRYYLKYSEMLRILLVFAGQSVPAFQLGSSEKAVKEQEAVNITLTHSLFLCSLYG